MDIDMATNGAGGGSAAAVAALSASLPDLQCAVCSQRGHGCHFGVVACRPCAAFFRRCITESRNYKCLRGTNKCDIRKEGHRNACKACRLRLCRVAGMVYTADKERDASCSPNSSDGGTGTTKTKSKKKQHQFGLQIEPNASTVERHLLEKVGAPTLGKIVHAYDAFIAGQRSLYLALHPEAAFQNHMTIAANIQDNAQMNVGSKPLMFSMLNEGIRPFAEMDHQTKLLLLEDASHAISILHCTYLTITEFPHPDDQRSMMNVGHMIDNSQLDMIIGKWAEGTTDPVEYIRIKKPVMEKIFKFVCIFKQYPEGVREQDFCALMAITIWNIAQQKFGHLREDWNEHKETIFSEWLLDLNSRMANLGPQASALFMGRLLCTLIELNTLTTAMEETTTLFRIFKPEALRLCAADEQTNAFTTIKASRD